MWRIGAAAASAMRSATSRDQNIGRRVIVLDGGACRSRIACRSLPPAPANATASASGGLNNTFHPRNACRRTAGVERTPASRRECVRLPFMLTIGAGHPARLDNQTPANPAFSRIVTFLSSYVCGAIVR